MSSGPRIVVTGLIAQFPLGGVTWDYFQYVLGLARLGYDVYYIEDTGQWPYHPAEGRLAEEPDFNVGYLAGVMERFGFADRWAYCFPWKEQWFGLSDAKRAEVVATADLLINVSGTLATPQKYGAKRLAYIDSDPVFTQVKLARGQEDFRALVDAHDVLFSFGEHHSEATPRTGDTWLPTRQPIVLDEWTPVAERRDVFTTVMSWSSFNPIEFAGKTYGQKDLEFKRFLDLPSRVAPVEIELAANKGKKFKLPADLLRHKGWKLVDPQTVSSGLDDYRDYIRTSCAEWSVAKNGYVVGRSGWFSCRSACYLAAARPVVVQETGFSSVLPVGDGVLAFTDLEEAAAGVKEVAARWQHHSDAARGLAEEWFDSDKVLASLVARAMER